MDDGQPGRSVRIALFVAAAVAGVAALALLWNRQVEPGQRPLEPVADLDEATTEPPVQDAARIVLRSAADTQQPAERASQVRVVQAAGPVRLRLVEAESRRAVPFYSVALERDGELLETLESDADGTLESSRPYAATTFQVRLLDVPDSPRERAEVVEWEHVGAALDVAELAIRCGPTYRLSLDAPGPIVPAELRAELRPRGSAVVEGLEPWTRARVHAGVQGTWSRIPLQAVTFRLGIRSWDLLVGDVGRGWAGEAPVQCARAGCLEDVTIALSGTQGLVGLVTEPSGAPVAGARIALSRLGADPGRSEPAAVDVAIADAEGNYRFEALAPGPYRAWVRSDAHQPFFGRIEIGPFEPTTRDFVLEPAELGVVEGLLLGASVADVERVTAVLFPRGVVGDTHQQRLVPEPGPDGSTLGRFRFENVLVGDYSLRLSGLPPGSIEPESLEIRPPGAALEFRRIDLGPLQSYGFLVRSAADGDELPVHSSWFEDTRNEPITSARDAERGVAVLRDWPVRLAFRWIVESPGFQPAAGEASAFTIRDPLVRTPRGQRLRVRGLFAEVALRPGWGTRVRVQGPEGALPGAAVLLDGRESAETDAQGEAWVLAAQAPARIEVRNLDWPPASVTLDPDPQAYRPGHYGYEFALRPR